MAAIIELKIYVGQDINLSDERLIELAERISAKVLESYDEPDNVYINRVITIVYKDKE